MDTNVYQTDARHTYIHTQTSHKIGKTILVINKSETEVPASHRAAQRFEHTQKVLEE